MKSRYLLGVDIGGTKCAAVLGTDRPEILARRSFPTASEPGPHGVIERLAREIAGLCAERSVPLEEIASLGVSCGGPLDAEGGVVLSPPNLPGWDRVEIVSILSRRLKIPASLRNDADACALAEWRWGAGRGARSMVFLTFGTGMGAGLILDGRLYRGASGMAGEVGHVRLAADGPLGYGKRGSFEGFCSGGGIAELAREAVAERLGRGEPVAFCASAEEAERLTARDVALAAERGDPLAAGIVAKSADYLGRGLAVIVDLLNPERIVIGSIFARAEGLFRAGMERALAEEALPLSLMRCSVVPAALGEAIGDYGALCVAMEGIGSGDK